MFPHKVPLSLSSDSCPLLQIVIDTEEEFNWHAGPDRKCTGVKSMLHIDRVQDIFNEYGLVPCYAVDYPIVEQPDGHLLLKQYAAAGQCEIGAHLHPWVNPPFTESLTIANMYPGNLPAELEREKLRLLRDKIAEVFGYIPRSYKAGRYGFGPNSAQIIAELGFDIDLSVCPPFDHRADGGPDYREYDARPFLFGEQRLLEIPVTGAYVGWAGQYSGFLFEQAQRYKKLKLPAILSRLRSVDRLVLSPEGFSSDEHIRLTRFLLKQGVRVFTWSFHSPSVVPGFTPYVQSEADLQRFLDSFRRYFDYFFNTLNGNGTSPSQLKHVMETSI